MAGPDRRVDIVALDFLEALSIRPVLEFYNATVSLHLVGEAKDVVRILGGEEKIADTIILSGHGDEKGLVLPELGPEIEKEQPYHGTTTPGDFKKFLNLPPGSLVLNTSCALGTEEMAGAFLGSGCRYYIGPTDYPDGTSAVFYALHFFYERICRGNGVEQAHQSARAHDDETAMFRLYRRR